MTFLSLMKFFVGAIVLLAAVTAEDSASNAHRQKRQAPNINVHQIPKTGFSCSDKKVGEYYADPETSCQVYHVCIPGMHNKMSLMSFVCPNGTIFNQATRVCSPYDRVDCSLALKFYDTVHGNLNSRRDDFEGDADYDNYVPPAPRPAPQQPARQPAARQPAASVPRQPVAPAQRQPSVPARAQAPAAPRNTIPPPQPEEPAQPARGSRFRSGASQFRGPQSRPAQTPAPAPAPARSVPPTVRQPVQPAIPARQAVPVVRPGVPGFRSPVPAARPPQTPSTQPPVAVPTRPTARAVVSTSTANYDYEYEYEYDYEDELPGQGNSRTKREAPFASYSGDYIAEGVDIEREPEKTSFSCDDKVPGGVYADIETDCEMFHICIPLSKHKMLDYKLYCANGTAFDQETGSCIAKTQFKCEKSHLYYQLDKLSQLASGKKPVYKKSNYAKSSKFATANKA